MKIAIISDTHNRREHVQRALQLMEEQGTELIVHCGDIEEPELVWLFPAHTHFVFGNCDYNRTALRLAIRELGATLHEPFGMLELKGKKLAFVHGDDDRLLHSLETDPQYDFVCHGHTHIASVATLSSTCIINPGALHRVNTRTFALLHLPEGVVESVVVQ